MKKHLSTIILILILLIGLSLLLYPAVSNYWNSFHSTKLISDYAEQMTGVNEEQYTEMLEAAVDYNMSLLDRLNPYVLSEEQKAQYDELLDLTGTGIMGYIEIESIGVSLPIYHGTGDDVLQTAVGHMEWTSLPVGGESTHCVLSGHRGLPSAKLFTHLDKLKEKDTFVLRIMDEILTYEVDKILIVDPNETEHSQIVRGRDLCTLVTCTPYGINSHRLLVRGHRIENAVAAKIVRVTADAVQIEPLLVAPIVASPILIVLFSYLLFKKPKKRGERRYDEGDFDL